MKYKQPFSIKNSRIIDADGKEVRLWGVNYHLPFSHNYINVSEVGKDHLKAIDRDIKDFKRLGIEFVRMHMFEREITDMNGKLIDNDHVRVFDYLIDRLYKAGIYVMITPIAWWSSAENLVWTEQNYAFWEITKIPTWSFVNTAPKHAMLWDNKMLECQEHYFEDLFSHKNRFSKKTLPEYENIVFVEAHNEHAHLDPPILDEIAKNPKSHYDEELINRLKSFANGREETVDLKKQFYAEIIKNYIRRIYKPIRKYFGKKALTCHLDYSNLETNPYILKVLREAEEIDCISVPGYPHGISGGVMHHDERNTLGDMRQMYHYYDDTNSTGKPMLCYEYCYNSLMEAAPIAAFAHSMASSGLQAAAYFTYTPHDVGEYNPGWLTQYLNLHYTPGRALALSAGKEIFDKTAPGSPSDLSDSVWKVQNAEIQKEPDRVIYNADGIFIHSSSAEDYKVKGKVSKIIGCGNSEFVKTESNGAYIIEIFDDKLVLDIMPPYKSVGDPYRGRSYNDMGNRYINCKREQPIARLLESDFEMSVRIEGFQDKDVYDENGNKIGSANGFKVNNGKYYIY